MLEEIIVVFHVLVALSILALVLVQQGKGSDIGAAFGSGASNTMFGSAGSASFLVKLTAFLAVLFFCTSLSLTYFSAHKAHEPAKSLLNLPTGVAPMVIPKADTASKHTQITHGKSEKK